MTYRLTNILFSILLGIVAVADWQMDVPFFLYGILALLYLLIVGHGTLFISAQFFIKTHCRATQVSNSIVLTFDDGPAGAKTSSVLNTLREHGVKATFFCIGKNIKAFPELTKQINSEGHLLANHSYHHGYFFDLQSSKKIIDELAETNKAIEESIGKTPRFFRPPYGVINPMVAKAIQAMNLLTIGWSVRSFDTLSKEKNALVARILKNLKGGDIILLHDRCDITIQVLPELLRKIKESGFIIEPLDKLLGEKAYL